MLIITPTLSLSHSLVRLADESQIQGTCKTLGNELKMQIFAKAQKCKANNINMKIQKQQLESKLGN